MTMQTSGNNNTNNGPMSPMAAATSPTNGHAMAMGMNMGYAPIPYAMNMNMSHMNMNVPIPPGSPPRLCTFFVSPTGCTKGIYYSLQWRRHVVHSVNLIVYIMSCHVSYNRHGV
jgi:hypothetical protein